MTLPEVGAVLDDKYEIESKLGQGGMAAVYRARHRYTHRTVAVKLLLPSIARDATVVERFLREARAASALDHPSAVAVLDVGRSAHGYYLVMEHLEGESLRARLARGTLSEEDALVLLEPLVSAVGAAHARGIIHRDIKPDNVFLRRLEDGSLAPKLLDFGVSKLTREEALTLTGTVIGTPEYLAPEQVLDSSRVGPAADVYQLGVLLFEMLTGTTPLSRPSYEAQLAAIVTEEPTPLRALRPTASVELERLIERATRRDVASRTPDAATLTREIRTLRARAELTEAPTLPGASAPDGGRRSGVAPTPAGPTPIVVSTPARLGWAAAGLGVAGGLAVATTWAVLTAPPREPESTPIRADMDSVTPPAPVPEATDSPATGAAPQPENDAQPESTAEPDDAGPAMEEPGPRTSRRSTRSDPAEGAPSAGRLSRDDF